MGWATVIAVGDHVNLGSMEVPTYGTVLEVFFARASAHPHSKEVEFAKIALASGVETTRKVRVLTVVSVLDVLAQAADPPPSDGSPL